MLAHYTTSDMPCNVILHACPPILAAHSLEGAINANMTNVTGIMQLMQDVLSGAICARHN